MHHSLESPTPHLHIEVKSIFEATRFLARNVSPSWQVTLGFLFLFCHSYSGQCTSLGRPQTHRHCSCWREAFLWTCTRCCSVTEREKKQILGLFENADCLNAETKQRCQHIFSFLLGEWGGVVCIVHSDCYQTIALFQGYCTGAILVRYLNKNEIVKCLLLWVRQDSG